MLRMFCLVVSMGIIAGCNNADSGKSESRIDKKSGEGNGKKAVKRWDGKFETIVNDWATLERIVNKSRGKVVLVDLWSTWCDPCIKELPNLAKLQNKYGDKIVCIAVNLNHGEPDKPPSKELIAEVDKSIRSRFATVLGNSGKLHSNFRLLICSEADEVIYEKVKVDSVPVIFVFSKSGERTRLDVNSVGGKDLSYEKHVNPVVEKYLNEPNPKK